MTLSLHAIDQHVMSYHGKTAIVTGGATGIGRALAVGLAKEGAKVAIADIELTQAQAVVEEIEAAGSEALAYQCDVADEGQVAQVFAKAFEDLGAIHFAFLNAGVVQIGKLYELKESDLEWMFKVNVFGAWYCARCFVNETRKAGGAPAHITFTGSENSLSLPDHAKYTGVGGYNMTKHAMLSMADTFRFELAGEGIGVSLAMPGGVLTQIMSSPEKRQEAFGGAGTLTMPDMDAMPKDLDPPPPNIRPEQAAEIILKGTAEGRFYVPTHAHIWQDFSQRASEIEAAFSGELY